MMLASVRTCPQRWDHYQRLRREYEALSLPYPLRTFQTSDSLDNPRINSTLTARAALSYGASHLPHNGWMLFLEDDARLHRALATSLPFLAEYGEAEGVDCWQLCNHRTPVERQFTVGEFVLNELRQPVIGSHALLLPQRHLRRILDAHWGTTVNGVIFRAIDRPGVRILQMIKPVLSEHIGEVSTFRPDHRVKQEVNTVNIDFGVAG